MLAYCRMRLRQQDGSWHEVTLPRTLSPAEATTLARAARECGLQAAVLTPSIPAHPSPRPPVRPHPYPTRPASRWQRQRAALFERDIDPRPTPAQDSISPESLRATLRRLLSQYGADAVRAALQGVSHP